jgi:hypothetical protein
MRQREAVATEAAGSDGITGKQRKACASGQAI